MGRYNYNDVTDFISCVYEVIEMTIEEIKQAIRKADLQLRPNILFVNPSDAKTIKDAIPEIEKTIVIQETEYIESGKAVVMDREILEKWEHNDFLYTKRDSIWEHKVEKNT